MINKFNKEVSKIEKEIIGNLSVFQKIYDNILKQIYKLKLISEKHEDEINNKKKEIIEKEKEINQHEVAKEDLLLKINEYEDKANKFAENFIL